MARRRASWPLGRGFDRWYGFHGGETHQFVPSLYHDNHAVLPPRTSPSGYHLSADLADRAIEFLGDLRAVDAEQPFFLYFATGACHSPHHAPPEWIERYRGQFDVGLGRVARARRSRARSRRVLLPPGTELSPRPHWVPAWDDARARGPGGRGAVHGVLRRVPLVHRRADRPAPRLPRARPATSTTRSSSLVSDNGASSEGGPTRLDQRRAPRATARSGRAARSCAPASTSSAARPRTTTTRGAGRWPATRRSSAGSARCTKAASPIRASCRWPRAVAATRARSATSSRTRSTCCPTVLELARHRRRPTTIDGVAQSPIDGTSFAYRPRRRGDARRSVTTRSTSRCSGRGRSTTTGWKAVTFQPLGAMYDDGLDPDAPFDDDVWELYHVGRGPVGDATTSPRRSPSGSRRWSTSGGRRRARNDVLPLDNRPRTRS